MYSISLQRICGIVVILPPNQEVEAINTGLGSKRASCLLSYLYATVFKIHNRAESRTLNGSLKAAMSRFSWRSKQSSRYEIKKKKKSSLWGHVFNVHVSLLISFQNSKAPPWDTWWWQSGKLPKSPTRGHTRLQRGAATRVPAVAPATNNYSEWIHSTYSLTKFQALSLGIKSPQCFTFL